MPLVLGDPRHFQNNEANTSLIGICSNTYVAYQKAIKINEVGWVGGALGLRCPLGVYGS